MRLRRELEGKDEECKHGSHNGQHYFLSDLLLFLLRLNSSTRFYLSLLVNDNANKNIRKICLYVLAMYSVFRILCIRDLCCGLDSKVLQLFMIE